MMSLEYKQRGRLFEFDFLKCLRTDYFHNSCQECFDICPLKAFYFDRGKLRVDLDICTNCSVCIGVCPTEALSLDFFDPNEYLLRKSKEEVELSCKKDIPCLSAFDSEHFIAFLLRNDKVFCDISHCQECELNKDDKTLESIKSKIKEANRFLNEIGIEKEIEYRDYEDSRRGFFKAVFSSTKEIFDAKKIEKNRISRVPVKLEILKESLKPYASDIKNKEIKTSYSFLAQKRVEDSCDNCGDCMQFCPTEALFSAKEGRAIWFIAGKCIKCEICNDICKQKSIINEDSIDIVKWCFNRGEELIEHTIEICTECNTPFSYKGGEMICNRCKEFIEDFSDIFKLASEE